MSSRSPNALICGFTLILPVLVSLSIIFYPSFKIFCTLSLFSLTVRYSRARMETIGLNLILSSDCRCAFLRMNAGKVIGVCLMGGWNHAEEIDALKQAAAPAEIWLASNRFRSHGSLNYRPPALGPTLPSEIKKWRNSD